eukprot:TRINITY_DN2367_c0_g1_i1.p1 TRINITY_DN2367_c0_g1~~TRINITY_DN2367_c0_g1_i1.p1  ORF type:complete len:703 (+),score=235.12 TRINITY_DN2367_c0_g1_i1:74-2182(+)
MKSVAMQAMLAVVLPVASAISYQMNYSADASPVKKVVELMNNMVAQGQKEMQAEKVQFATYSQWCKMTREKKTGAIEEASDEIQSLKADIEKLTADAERLSSEIEGHQTDIESLSQETDQLTKVRDQEAADYNAAAKDYAESISALSRAVATLKKQAYDRKQAAKATSEEAEESLLELSPLAAIHSQTSVREVHEAVSAFIQQSKKSMAGKPEVAGYEFQSNGIIKMLSELQDKFQAEKVDLEKAEFDKKASFEVTKAGLQNEADAEKKDLDKKLIFKQKKLSTKAKLEDQLSTTVDTKKSDQEYLDEISTTCDQKATDFKARQKLRGEELEAVNKAIEVISSPDVMGNEKKHLWKSFIQMKSKSETSLAVLRLRQARSDVKDKIAFFLQREAERIQSSSLSKMALALSTQADDDSTMKMIKNMLTKLLDDLQQKALADQTKKDACDKKLAVNKQTRAEKTASTEEIQADLDVLQEQVAKLEKQIGELTEQVSDIDSTVKNATDIRNKEKAENTQAISDAQAAQAAVAQATSVLREFYEKAGQATALVQKSSKSVQPAIFDAPYKGMGGESGGVVGMLEVIASDFAKLEAETKSEEETSASEFEKFVKDSKLNKIQMTTDIKHKKESSTDSKARISEKSSEFDMEEQALKASLAEYDALKEECLNTGLDYEEEKKRREETIESLQKALTMLSGLATGVTAQR